jgi:Flp pilus assembly pilin Flp
MTVLKNNRGQGLTEYLVLLMLVAVASIGLVAGLGKTVRGKIKEAQQHIDKVSADTSSADTLAGNQQ